MDVLCPDKAGTITKNEIKVAEVGPLEGCDESDVLLAGALASREENRDPIDGAILTEVHDTPTAMHRAASSAASEFKPFDPVIKRSEAEVREAGDPPSRVTKGAPQVILELAGQAEGESTIDDVDQYVEDYASGGRRAPGIARTFDGDPWRHVGLIALHDPPRDDSAQTISAAQQMPWR